MRKMHPMTPQYDISVKRVDRVIPLLVRMVLTIPVCYVGARDMYYWTIGIVSIMLLPLPYCAYKHCRKKFKING